MGGRWLLYFHTIRNLKPRQVLWRGWRRLSVFPAPDAGPPPALRRGAQPLDRDAKGPSAALRAKQDDD